MRYDNYIASVDWQQKRERRTAIDGHRCRLCDHDGSVWRLEVHHRPASYERMPHESVADDLTTVCARCHGRITDAIRSDRYAARPHQIPISVQVSTVIERRALDHGLAKSPLPFDIRQCAAVEQRQQCQPAQRVGAGDETH